MADTSDVRVNILASSPAMARRHMDVAWTFLTRFPGVQSQVFKFGTFSICATRDLDGTVSTTEQSL